MSRTSRWYPPITLAIRIPALSTHLATDVAGDLVKVITWYDNEWGYSCRTADLTKFVGDRL